MTGFDIFISIILAVDLFLVVYGAYKEDYQRANYNLLWAILLFLLLKL